MKVNIFIFFILYAFHGVFAQSWSREKIVSQAIAQSPRVASLQNQLLAQKGTLQQAKAIPNPEVGGITGNRTQMLAVGQSIEYPAKRKVRVKQAETEYETARWRLAQAEHEIAAEALTLLYTILDADRKAELFQQNLAVAQQLYSAAHKKFDEGFGSRLDVIKAQVEMARARRLLQSAKRKKAVRRSDLKLALGLASSDTLVLADVLGVALLPCPANLDSLLQRAINNPQMQMQRYQTQESRLDVQAARLSNRPDFSFDLSGGVEDHESKVELEMHFPLALWDRKAGLRSKAHFLNKSAQNDSVAVWLDISRRVAAAVYNYQNTQQTMQLFEQSLVDEARSAADMAQQAFQSGQYRFLDLIDARRTYLETAQEFIEAQASLRLAEVEVLQTAGIFFPGEK